MSGYCVRIQRGGHWDSIDIDELTDDELETLARDYPPKGWFFAIVLAQWIRDNVVAGPTAHEKTQRDSLGAPR